MATQSVNAWVQGSPPSLVTPPHLRTTPWRRRSPHLSQDGENPREQYVVTLKYGKI